MFTYKSSTLESKFSDLIVFSKNSIDLKFDESISGGNGFELLTMIDMAKSYCKCFIISGEATLEIFNSKDELFFNSH